MGKKDKRVDEYIAKSAMFAQPVLKHLRELVHATCPSVEEKIKWGFPHFDYKGMMCSMAGFKEHCSFGFWKASLMSDAEKFLTTDGNTSMGHFGRITKLSDLPSDTALKKYIKEAAQLNDAGIKLPPKPKTRVVKELVVPDYFAKALSKNKQALMLFNEFPPSHKREYVEWITEAKTDETRDKRIATALEWIAEGKSRNWKYARK